ncbi:ribose-phosphate pyrophosphokinase [Pilibacter termitis]|uniref:Putative ribose-phosphate pyrophosphokinase n=1 Tax=Pilibacter termitis TaxID=263852 RepID=A0A1T4RFU3_9ENTE|nr:ribose-phosphate diphosphokinase [Pilibacter termitis]SKA14531.1 ribose-phosphate pyrophosphokinase [Pilibacter termitis]
MKKWADGEARLFGLNASSELSEKISKVLGTPLGAMSSRQFSDGEIQLNIEETVRGRDVYLIQATNYPVNDHLWELLIMIDAMQRASAKTVNVIMPYFGYARQDRTAAPREPITAKLVADMLTKAGVTRLLTLDLHTVQVQGFFDIPVDNLFTIPLFAKYYREKGLMGDDVVVVSPKNSGIKRARSLAEYLESPLAIIDHEEDDKGRERGYIIGEVAGKKAIMVDDILNTGTTFFAGAEVLEKAGVSEIYACASHGILSNNAKELMDLTAIKEVTITDSVEIPEEHRPKRLKVITASTLMADAIRRIHENEPMSPLFK